MESSYAVFLIESEKSESWRVHMVFESSEKSNNLVLKLVNCNRNSEIS